MKFLRSKYFRFLLSLLVGGISLYLALRNISVEDFWASINRADWGWVGLALFSVLANTLAKVVRWRVLAASGHMRAGKGQVRAGFSKLLMALLAGQALNSLYPARVGDLGRAYAAGENGTERAFLLGTIALEKILDLLSYGMLLLLVLLLMPLPAWLNRSFYGLIAVAVLLAVAALILSHNRTWGKRILKRFQERWPTWMPERVIAFLRAAYASLDVLRSGWDLLRVAFWSAVVWGTAVWTNYLVIQALDIQFDGRENGMSAAFLASCLVLVGLTVGISLPSVPGRIGIFEYICVLALAVFGVPQAAAFVYGVLLHSIVFLPSTLAGLISMVILGWPGDRSKLLDLVGGQGK